MNDNNPKNTCNRHNLSSTNSAKHPQQDISQTASQPPATIRKPQLLTDYTYRNRRIHAGAVTRRLRIASQTQAGH